MRVVDRINRIGTRTIERYSDVPTEDIVIEQIAPVH